LFQSNKCSAILRKPGNGSSQNRGHHIDAEDFQSKRPRLAVLTGGLR
jgi:hypothetical protein